MGLSPRKLVGGALLLACVGALPVLRGARVDNRLERWVGSDDEGAERYREFLATFGGDELVVVGIRGDDLFAPEPLAALVALSERLEALSGVREVEGLPVVYRQRLAGQGGEALRAEAHATPFYRGLFLGSDDGTLGLLVLLDLEDRPAARRELVAEMREALVPLRELGIEADLVGSTALIVALDEASVAGSRRAFEVALVSSLAALLLLGGSWRTAVVAAICSAVSVVLTLALMVACGRSLNMITSALPALLWVLSLSGTAHILRRFSRHAAEHETSEALARALRGVTRPCTVSALTTALGFFSLVVARLAPVRELGLFAGVGILLSLAVQLTSVPLLIHWLHPRARSSAPPAPLRRLAFLLRRESRHPRIVLLTTAALSIGALVLVPRISVDSNPLSFLPEGHPTRHAYEWVGAKLTGFYALETVVRLPEPWTSPAVWPVVDSLTEDLSASPIVARVLSPLDVLRQLGHWLLDTGYRLPDGRAQAEQLLALPRRWGRDPVRDLVAANGTELRLSAIVREMDQGRYLALVEAVRRRLAELPAGYSAYVTGQVLRLVEAQRDLVRTQLESLGSALVVIFLSIAVGMRSLRAMWLALPPNLFPLLAAFAVMALAGISLDAATVMVASVTLGIAVDHSVHLLSEIDVIQGAGADGETAVEEALLRVGPPIALTTVTACAGFLALAVSEFVPIRSFGLLAAAAMVAALLANLLLLPALHLAFSPRLSNGPHSS